MWLSPEITPVLCRLFITVLEREAGRQGEGYHNRHRGSASLYLSLALGLSKEWCVCVCHPPPDPQQPPQ